MPHIRQSSFDSQDDFQLPQRPGDGYEGDSSSRRVRFLDDHSFRVSRCRGGGSHRNGSNMSVHEITRELKGSYNTISRGQEILRKLYEDLLRSKECIHFYPDACQNGGLDNVNRLLQETEQLQASLSQAAERKKHYMSELTRLQATLHEDRRKMEEWAKLSRDSKKTLQTKLNESSRITKEQQTLIRKLKKDNECLWSILQEIQKHLQEEKYTLYGFPDTIRGLEAINEMRESPDNGSIDVQVQQFGNQTQLNESSYFRHYDQYSACGSSECTVERAGSVGSAASSEETFMSHKLRELLLQSENIQKLIKNVGQKRREQERMEFIQLPEPPVETETASREVRTTTTTTSCRIPSEDERGVRSDMNDLMRRCRELEEKVNDCSTKAVQEKLVKEIDKLDSSKKQCCNNNLVVDARPCACRFPTDDNWDYMQHKRVREELLQCLDRTSNLERNFSNAQDEIARLRNYVKETQEEKEFCEQTYKREAIELRSIVDEKNHEINRLNNLLDQTTKSLNDHSQRMREVEDVLLERDEEIRILKARDCDTRMLKNTLEEKTKELESLKVEMLTAVQSLEKIQSQDISTYEELRTENRTLKMQISTLQSENNNLRRRNDETIAEELKALQRAIEETERKMKKEQLECMSIKEKFEKSKIEWTRERNMLRSRIEEKEHLLQRTVADSEHEMRRLRYNLRNFETMNKTRQSKTWESKHELADFHLTKVVDRLTGKNDDLERLLVKKDDVILEQQQRLENLVGVIEKVKRQYDVYKDDISPTSAKGTDFSTWLEKISCGIEDNKLRDEIQGMRNELGTSHNELVDKLLKLQAQVDKLLDENRELRRMLDSTGSRAVDETLTLKRQVHELQEQKALLEGTIDTTYPGLVEGTLNREEKLNSALGENKILRSLLGSSRERIVDKNLQLEREIQALQHKNVDREPRRPSSLQLSPRGRPDRRRCASSRSRSISPTVYDELFANMDTPTRTIILGASDKSSQKNYERRRSSSVGMDSKVTQLNQMVHELQSEREAITETLDKGTKNVINKLLQLQNQLSVLQEENEKLQVIHSRLKSSDAKSLVTQTEIEEMRQECEKLKQFYESLGYSDEEYAESKSYARLQKENILLRDIIESYGDSVPFGGYDKRMKDLEEEVLRLTSRQEARERSPDSRSGKNSKRQTPNELRLPSPSRQADNEEAQRKSKELHAENVKLRSELDKATSNLTKLAKILEKEKSSSAMDKAAKVKSGRLEEKLIKMDNENEKMKTELSSLVTQNKGLQEELSRLNRINASLSDEKHVANQEAQRLRNALRDLHSNINEEQSLKESIGVLNDTIDGLQSRNSDLEQQLQMCEKEKRALQKANQEQKTKINHLEGPSNELRKIESANYDLEQNLMNANYEINEVRKRNKELEEEKIKLEHEFDKLQNELSEKHFSAWLEKDSEKRLALLSPDAPLGPDDEEKMSKRDHGRLIRRLQVENQTLKAKMSSLEDEAVATTKIIGDMERGHGHLTGTLRCHLILQQGTTGKLLEGALQQYQAEHESLKRKFQNIEDKFDKSKQYSKRRSYAWDLFKNATGTLNNIHTILNEGLIKVEDDLGKDFADEDFEAKDYKSRLWILRRRLSDVENRHRELQLRAEELSIRLDAKTAEYEVTQDELEDTTRDLESREGSVKDLRGELNRISRENSDLRSLIRELRDHQEKTVGEIMSENDALRAMADELSAGPVDEHLRYLEGEVDNMKKLLEEKARSMKSLQKTVDVLKQDLQSRNNTIAKLEARLKEMTDERDKLRREAGYRAGYMPSLPDQPGTIHLLRDDIKKLSKENSELKKDIVFKQRQIYDMSKDLNRLRQETGEGGRRSPTKKSAETQMLNEIAKAKTENAILAAKYTELSGKYRQLTESDDHVEPITIESKDQVLEKQMVDLYREVDLLKKQLSDLKGKSPSRPETTKRNAEDATDQHLLREENARLKAENLLLMDVIGAQGKSPRSSANRLMQELRDLKAQNEKLRADYSLLSAVIEQKGQTDLVHATKRIKSLEERVLQQNAEIDSLNSDLLAKRNRIRELVEKIESMHEGTDDFGTIAYAEETRQNELRSLNSSLQQKVEEVRLWKDKADGLQQEIDRLKSQSSMSTVSADDDRFRKLYLNVQQRPDSKTASTSHVSVTPDAAGRSRSAISLSGSPTGSNSQVQPLYGVLLADAPEAADLLLFEEQARPDTSTGALQKPVIKGMGSSPKSQIASGAQRGDIKYTPSLPPRSVKPGEHPSKIPISPVKRKQSERKGSKSSPESPRNGNKTVGTLSREEILERQLKEQHEDIQTLLLSVDLFERENERLKEQLHTDSNDEENDTVALGSKSKVNKFADTLTRELTMYRSLLGISEHENLTTLTETQLKNIIQYHLQTDQDMDALTLRHDNRLLQAENDSLRAENHYTKSLLTPRVSPRTPRLSLSLDSDASEINFETMRQKYEMKDTENKTLKELVKSHEETIESHEISLLKLRTEIKENKSKHQQKEIDLNNAMTEMEAGMNQLKTQSAEQISDLSSKLANITDENRQLSAELHQRKEEDHITSNLNKKVVEIEQSRKAEVETLSKEKESLQRIINETNSRKLDQENEYVKQLANKDAELRKLQNDIQRERDTISDLNVTIAKLNEDQKVDRRLTDDLHEKFQRAFEEKNLSLSISEEALNNAKAAHTEEIAAYEKEIADLRKQIRDYKVLVERGDSSSELEHLKNELNGVVEELSETQSSLEVLKKQNIELSRENDSIRQELSSREETESTVNAIEEEKLENMKEQNEALSTRILYLEEVLEDEEKELEQAKYDLEQSIQLVKDLETENAALNSENSLLRTDLETNQAEKTELATLVEDLQGRLEEIGNSSTADQYDALVEEHTWTTEQLAMKEIQLTELNLELNEKQKEIVQVRSLNSALTQNRNQLQNEVKSLKLKIESLITDSEKSENNWKIRYDQAVEEATSVGASLKAEIAELNKTIKALDKEIATKDNELKKYKENSANDSDLKPIEEELIAPTVNTDENEPPSSPMLRSVLTSKDALIMKLQKEVENMETQYNQVLTALNRRREESKKFLMLQEKLQEEIEQKENFIKQLQEKLKANENKSTDERKLDSLDEALKEKESELWTDQQNSIKMLTEQISKMRSRNSELKHELENSREELFKHKLELNEAHSKSSELEMENEDLKTNMLELRNIMHGDKNLDESDDPVVKEMSVKLYDAYNELREKAIEIANLKTELDQELAKLKRKSSVDETERETAAKSKLKDSTEAGSEVERLIAEIRAHDHHEMELQSQITELRQKLINKDKHCDYLQGELTSVLSKLKDVEGRLLQEDRSIRVRTGYESDDSLTTDITSVTPESMISSYTTRTADSVSKRESSAYEHLSILQGKVFQMKIEINQLKTELQVKKSDLDSLQTKFKRSETSLQNCQREIFELENEKKRLQSKLNAVSRKATTTDSEDSSALSAEITHLKSLLEEVISAKKALEEKLNNIEHYHEAQLSNLRNTLTAAKNEHVKSLKEDFDKVLKEKAELHVRCRELMELITEKEKRLIFLQAEKQELENQLNYYEQPSDEPDETLTMVENVVRSPRGSTAHTTSAGSSPRQ